MRRYRVRVSPKAVLDLIEIRAFIAGNGGPSAALKHADKLERLITTLELFPERGRHLGGGIRELTAVTPHIVRYRISGSHVEVIRIRHGAMQLDP